MPLLNCQDGKVTSFGSNSSVLSVASSLARLGPALSANTRLSQSEWQEAVANFLIKSDDLTLCPGSELLSPVEKQVSKPTEYFSFKLDYYFLIQCYLSISDLPKSTFETIVLYIIEGQSHIGKSNRTRFFFQISTTIKCFFLFRVEPTRLHFYLAWLLTSSLWL